MDTVKQVDQKNQIYNVDTSDLELKIDDVIYSGIVSNLPCDNCPNKGKICNCILGSPMVKW